MQSPMMNRAKYLERFMGTGLPPHTHTPRTFLKNALGFLTWEEQGLTWNSSERHMLDGSVRNLAKRKLFSKLLLQKDNDRTSLELTLILDYTFLFSSIFPGILIINRFCYFLWWKAKNKNIQNKTNHSFLLKYFIYQRSKKAFYCSWDLFYSH